MFHFLSKNSARKLSEEMPCNVLLLGEWDLVDVPNLAFTMNAGEARAKKHWDGEIGGLEENRWEPFGD